MTATLPALLRALQQAGLDIDAEAALDSVWLALRMHERAPGAPGTRSRDGRVDTRVAGDGASGALPTEATVAEVADTAPPRDSLAERSGAFARPFRTTTGAASARSLTLERAAALPDSRDLIKALRPLRRRVVSPGSGVLDVDTTVRRAAEEDLWIPSFEAARERWLDVLLVADHALSMIVWKDTIDEFERVLRNCGAFRSVRSWWLESDADRLAVTARGRGASPATPNDLTRLTRGSARSVVLVISDCVGARWHDGAVPRLLERWSRRIPLALVQVTPEWFWARTALGDTVASRFRSPVPAAVNRLFRWDPGAFGATGVSPELDATLLRVPIATLTWGALGRVAGLVAGVGREWSPGVVFDLTWEGDDSMPPRPPTAAGERVSRFRALASKSAQRLAAAYAASPVQTLGVLRLLRRDLLPDANPFTEAEVLLGGIVRVRRDQARWDAGASLPLEFFPGTQAMLLDGALASDVVKVLARAASVAASGVGPTFTSWLDDPASSAAKLDPGESDFAAAAATVLARLGGAYARIVMPGAVGVESETSASDPSNAEARNEASGSSAAAAGPHELPAPVAFVGRVETLRRFDRWFEEKGPQRGIVALVGPRGIGKSAIAAQVQRRWSERWPDEVPFVWSFERDPRVEEALQAMRDRYDPHMTTAPTTSELPRAIARHKRSLAILDAVDRVKDPDVLMLTVESIARIEGARVVITTTREPPDLWGMTPLEVGPITEDEFAELIAARLALANAKGAPIAPDGAAETTSALWQVSGGNPLVGITLLPKAMTITPAAMLEELTPRPGELTVVQPDQLATIEALLDTAARARALSAEGAALDEAGATKDALAKFDEVVRMRGRLPSLRLRARALFDRGRTSLALAVLDRASADLADAVGIYRMVSAERELVSAMEALAEARLATDRNEEARALMTEAFDIAQRNHDEPRAFRVLLRLAAVCSRLGAVAEALGHSNRALELAQRNKDPRLTGVAYLQIGRVEAERGHAREALMAARQAVEHLRSANESVLLAEAFDEIAALEETAGNFRDAIAALEQLRELRPADSEAIAVRMRRLAAREETPDSAAPSPEQKGGSPDDDRDVSMEFLVSGRLQGVGFRAFVDRQARDVGVQGSAQNLADGRVRVQATGPRARLDELEARLRRGPPMAKVEEVATRVLDDPSAGERARGAAEAPRTQRARLEAFRSRRRAVISIGVGRGAGLPALPPAVAAARRFADWALAQGGAVTLLLDEDATQAAIFRAVTSIVDGPAVHQLLVYFAGYAINANRREIWLLPGAPRDPGAAIDVQGSVELARYCGVPHVVFVSDTCRVSPDGISALHVIGGSAFPSVASSHQPGAVDQLYATRPGRPAHESGDVNEAAARYHTAYTDAMLDVLTGADRSIPGQRDGAQVITVRGLAAYLRQAIPDILRARNLRLADTQQIPAANIESGDDDWLAFVEASPPS